jgi:transcription-repair coupling factor (superfamily II helicase)
MRALTAGSYLAPVSRLGASAASAKGRVVRVSGVSGSVRAVILSGAALEAGRMVVVTPSEGTASILRQDLAALLPEQAAAAGVSAPAVLALPGLEADPYQGIGPHPQILAERAATLARVLRSPRYLVVTPCAALLVPLLPVDRFAARFLGLRKGEALPYERLAGLLEGAGYQRVDMASSPGEWARRGGIFDVFPPGSDDPIRIELEDDQVASLRLFDRYTQRSLEERDAVEIPPARESPLGREEKRELQDRLEKMPRTGGRPLAFDPLAALVLEGSFAGVEMCAGLWAGRGTDLLDYAGGATLVVDEPLQVEAEIESHLAELAASREASGSILAPPERLLLPRDRVEGRLAGRRIELHDLSLAADQEAIEADTGEEIRLEVEARPPRAYFGRLADFTKDVKGRGAGQRTLILVESDGMLERTREVLEEQGLPPVVLPATIPQGGALPELVLARGRLAHGFEVPAERLTVLTQRDLYGETRAKQARGGRRASPFRSDFRDLALGDLVVHVDHGVGKYQGIKRLDSGGPGSEFMVLVYGDDAVLYVPVERLDLVQRYSGAGGKAPAIDRLGSPRWNRVRRRIRGEMQDIAAQLLDLYAARRALPGRACGPDTPWQAEFEAAFPFRLTIDQVQAIADVKRDMETSFPMDRLLCGDVGFGKTEVALRAVFKAVMDGCQAAVLAPTTVLAFQHFNTFRDRMAPFPVTVEMLSRFQNRAEQRRIVTMLKDGRIDVVIGTHRLLSKDVGFHDLGLLVVDEEQRFGVVHKERLKQMRRSVDVLTLTATPIPRTLQMSLAGVRDLSVIETPPENRLSIQTLVLPFRPAILAQAVRREIRRSGQVFFVHNRIASLPAMASVLRREVPEATLEMAHGGMDERRLEDIMLRFVAGEFQILLTTTIIENGLDIPRANTLIVNRADRFGLAQLYQLRGRVGRSDVRAYAYLFIPSARRLTPIARRRLKALQEFSELGAGFRLAARDLEIRGAGEMLGGRQHGHIAALGFDLYTSMLENAVREKRGKAAPAPEVRVSLELGVEFRLPVEFMPEAHERLILYKRVAAAAAAGDLERVREELEDRFGHLPQQAENLLEVAAVRQLAERLGIATVTAQGPSLGFHFVDGAPIEAGRLLSWVKERRGRATLAPSGLLKITTSEDPEARLREGRAVLEAIAEQAGTVSGMVPS